jgi:hypothetical protein
MTAKEMKAELPKLDAQVKRLKSSMRRLDAIKKRMLQECPTNMLEQLTPVITALADGKKGGLQELVIGLGPRACSDLRSVLGMLDGWDGMGTKQIDAEIETLETRKTLILQALPSTEEVSEATQRLNAMRGDLRDKRNRYADAFQAYLETLKLAVEAARAVVDSKPSAKLAGNINALMNDYALNGPHEQVKEGLDRDDLNLAVSLTRLLVQVSSAQTIDIIVDKEVRTALSKRVKAAA